MRRTRFLLLAGAATVLAFGPLTTAPVAGADTPAYVAIDLGAAVHAHDSAANAIDGAGEVAGVSGGRAMSWTETGGWVPVAGPGTAANAISTAGRIAGGRPTTLGSSNGDPPGIAETWQSAAGVAPVDVGSIGGTGFAVATGVDDAGEVVGYGAYASTSIDTHAFAWTPAGGLHDLGTLGGTQSGATGVNASGVVVGWSYTTGNVATHAFRWTPGGGMVDLGTLLPGGQSTATAIDDAGEIVGSASTSTAMPSDGDAVSWSSAGAISDLGPSIPGRDSYATAIASTGQIVGTVVIGSTIGGFSYTPGAGTSEFTGIGGARAYVTGVDTAGQIVGSSLVGGVTHGTLWQRADAAPLAPARPTLAGETGENPPAGADEVTADAIIYVLGQVGPLGGLATLYRGDLAVGTTPVAPGDGVAEVVDRVPADGIYRYSWTIADGSGRVSPRGAALLVAVATPPASAASALPTHVVGPAVKTAVTNTTTVKAKAGAKLALRAARAGGTARAGHTFTVAIAVARGGTLLRSATLAWTVRIGTRAVRHSSRFRAGSARLTLTIPAGTRGRLLQIGLRARAGGATATRTLAYRIR